MFVNEKQKRLILICLGVMILTILFVPQEFSFLVGGEGGAVPKTKFQGYQFIANVNGEIALKHLFAEWVTLLVVFVGMFFYYREDKGKS